MVDLGVRLDDRSGGIDAEDREVERHADDDDEVALLGDGARLRRVRGRGDLAARIQDEPDRRRRPDRAYTSGCHRPPRSVAAGVEESAAVASGRSGWGWAHHRKPAIAMTRIAPMTPRSALRMRDRVTNRFGSPVRRRHGGHVAQAPPRAPARRAAGDPGHRSSGSGRPASATTSAPHSCVCPAGGSGGPSYGGQILASGVDVVDDARIADLEDAGLQGTRLRSSMTSGGIRSGAMRSQRVKPDGRHEHRPSRLAVPGRPQDRRRGSRRAPR